ncbi:MAG: hypothetical protein ACOH15_04010 [Acetobacterium sp.]
MRCLYAPNFSNKKSNIDAKAAAKTGIGPTALVATVQYFPENERIIDDNLAYRIIPSGKVFVWLMQPKWLRNWVIRIDREELARFICLYDVQKAVHR